MEANSNNTESQKLSIVIPSYNEEQNIPLLFDKIKNSVNNIAYECIFVDDGSSDNTFKQIELLSEKYPEVKGLSFSRNFGHQIALLAGLQHSTGDIIVMMDADGQHPPEIIKQLIDEYKNGYEIVNTRRLTTANSGVIKDNTSKWYYKIINSLSEVKIEPASSDFRLMTRKAVDAFLQLEEKDRFTRGLISWIGFKQSIIDFEAPDRMTGTSKYTFKKMIRFAFDGITSFSSKPLKFSLYSGIFALLFGVAYSIYALVVFIMGETIPGWTSMILVILFLGGIQLISIGIIGEYQARIFNESKKRPHYFIQKKC